jgi:hypothetical protein
VGGLHLVAYALGAGAIGMRFLDSEVLDLLGEPDDLVTLLFTGVAVPEYASRRTRSPEGDGGCADVYWRRMSESEVSSRRPNIDVADGQCNMTGDLRA